MSRFSAVFLVACLWAPLASYAQHRPRPRIPAIKALTPAAQQQAPAAAPQAATSQAETPTPTTPEHGPSSPPEVTFKGGQLTITARNSTLSDVLNAVKVKTGAAVEMPAAPSERVVGQFGPGAPRDVMAQLLNGSHFNYVLLGSPSDPGALNKVVLMTRATGPEPAPQQPQPAQGFEQPLQAVPQLQTDQPDDNQEPPMEVQQAPEEEPQQEQPPDQPEQGPPGQAPPNVKTPEQLLRELQQQQQQQQQQNGQQPQQ